TLLAIVESIIYLMVLALGLWLAALTMMDDPISFGTVVQSALIYLPALWLMIGITVLIFGYVPKITSVIWLYYAFCYVVAYVGGMLKFPDWMKNVSVFEVIPKLPGEEINVIVLILV